MADTHPKVPPLVGIQELARMCRVRPNTAYHWRSDTLAGTAKDPLPQPDAYVSGSPVWTEQKALAWAAATGKDINPQWRESAR